MNETARREALIAPILLEVTELSDRRIYIEYSIAVNEHLRGTVDVPEELTPLLEILVRIVGENN